MGCPAGARLIPAHAGKTAAAGGMSSWGAAHPRSRGENIFHGRAVFLHGGSSPLTRGKLRGVLDGDLDLRLIPAHAGKTHEPSREPRSCPAHPRSRGENQLRNSLKSSCEGSSPLTRGKLGQRIDVAVNRGLIPAHAGKTSCPVTLPGVGAAHPRSRGENRPPSFHSFSLEGSSPLTRGKRRSRRGRCGSRGLIPAHAGKTMSL